MDTLTHIGKMSRWFDTQWKILEESKFVSRGAVSKFSNLNLGKGLCLRLTRINSTFPVLKLTAWQY